MVNNQREKLLAITTGIIVLVIGFYSLVVEPQVNKRKELLKELYEKQTVFTKMQCDLLLKESIDENYSRIESLIKSDGTDQDEMSAFSQEFQKLNSKFSLKPRTIKFLPMINDPCYRKILVKVELIGGIKNIVDFISNVENGEKTMKFEKVSFVTKDRDDNIKFSFVLSKVISNASKTTTLKIQ